MKKVLSILVMVSLLLALLTGCGQTATTTTAAGTTAAPDASSTAAPATKTKIGLITVVGGLGDQSYNDLSFAGCKQAEADLGIELQYVEPKTISDYETMQRQMASDGSFDLIVTIAFDQMEPLAKVAADFPDQKFIILDAVVDLPNVASYVSEEQEGSFLVGALAGLLHKESQLPQLAGKTTTGVVGGMDIPIINKFVAGYEAGVRYVNPDMTVVHDYVGGWNDPTTAKEISKVMYGKGAGIIYHAAGGSGLGVFQEAKEQNLLAIGVNSNQNSIDPDHIVASMLKRVDTAAYSAIKDVVDGTFTAGVHTLGLKQEGIGYDLTGSNVQVPQSVIDQVEAIKAEIISGNIKVPTALEEVEPFLAGNTYQK